MITTIRSINNIASNHHKYTISSQTKWYRHQLTSILDDSDIGLNNNHHITTD